MSISGVPQRVVSKVIGQVYEQVSDYIVLQIRSCLSFSCMLNRNRRPSFLLRKRRWMPGNAGVMWTRTVSPTVWYGDLNYFPAFCLARQCLLAAAGNLTSAVADPLMGGYRSLSTER